MSYHRLSEALQDYLLSSHRNPNDTEVHQALHYIRKSPLGYFFNLPTVVPIEPTRERTTAITSSATYNGQPEVHRFASSISVERAQGETFFREFINTEHSAQQVKTTLAKHIETLQDICNNGLRDIDCDASYQGDLRHSLASLKQRLTTLPEATRQAAINVLEGNPISENVDSESVLLDRQIAREKQELLQTNSANTPPQAAHEDTTQTTIHSSTTTSSSEHAQTSMQTQEVIYLVNTIYNRQQCLTVLPNMENHIQETDITKNQLFLGFFNYSFTRNQQNKVDCDRILTLIDECKQYQIAATGNSASCWQGMQQRCQMLGYQIQQSTQPSCLLRIAEDDFMPAYQRLRNTYDWCKITTTEDGQVALPEILEHLSVRAINLKTLSQSTQTMVNRSAQLTPTICTDTNPTIQALEGSLETLIQQLSGEETISATDTHIDEHIVMIIDKITKQLAIMGCHEEQSRCALWLAAYTGPQQSKNTFIQIWASLLSKIQPYYYQGKEATMQKGDIPLLSKLQSQIDNQWKHPCEQATNACVQAIEYTRTYHNAQNRNWKKNASQRIQELLDHYRCDWHFLASKNNIKCIDLIMNNLLDNPPEEPRINLVDSCYGDTALSMAIMKYPRWHNKSGIGRNIELFFAASTKSHDEITTLAEMNRLDLILQLLQSHFGRGILKKSLTIPTLIRNQTIVSTIIDALFASINNGTTPEQPCDMAIECLKIIHQHCTNTANQVVYAQLLETAWRYLKDPESEASKQCQNYDTRHQGNQRSIAILREEEQYQQRFSEKSDVDPQPPLWHSMQQILGSSRHQLLGAPWQSISQRIANNPEPIQIIPLWQVYEAHFQKQNLCDETDLNWSLSVAVEKQNAIIHYLLDASRPWKIEDRYNQRAVYHMLYQPDAAGEQWVCDHLFDYLHQHPLSLDSFIQEHFTANSEAQTIAFTEKIALYLLKHGQISHLVNYDILKSIIDPRRILAEPEHHWLSTNSELKGIFPMNIHPNSNIYRKYEGRNEIHTSGYHKNPEERHIQQKNNLSTTTSETEWPSLKKTLHTRILKAGMLAQNASEIINILLSRTLSQRLDAQYAMLNSTQTAPHTQHTPSAQAQLSALITQENNYYAYHEEENLLTFAITKHRYDIANRLLEHLPPTSIQQFNHDNTLLYTGITSIIMKSWDIGEQDTRDKYQLYIFGELNGGRHRYYKLDIDFTFHIPNELQSFCKSLIQKMDEEHLGQRDENGNNILSKIIDFQKNNYGCVDFSGLSEIYILLINRMHTEDLVLTPGLKSILDLAVKSENIHPDPFAFAKALITKLSGEQLNQMRNNHDTTQCLLEEYIKWRLLDNSRYYPLWIELINKTQADDLGFTNQHRQTILQQILKNKNPNIDFTEHCIQRLTPETLLHRDLGEQSAIDQLIEHNAPALLLQLMTRIEPARLTAHLQEKNSQGFSILESVRALEQWNLAIILQNHLAPEQGFSWEILYPGSQSPQLLVSYKEHGRYISPIIEASIAKASTENLIMQNDDGNTLLHLAIQQKDDQLVSTIINRYQTLTNVNDIKLWTCKNQNDLIPLALLLQTVSMQQLPLATKLASAHQESLDLPELDNTLSEAQLALYCWIKHKRGQKLQLHHYSTPSINQLINWTNSHPQIFTILWQQAHQDHQLKNKNDVSFYHKMLCHCAAHNAINILEQLIEEYHQARAKEPDAEIFQSYLLTQGDIINEDNSPLIVAAKCGNGHILDSLISTIIANQQSLRSGYNCLSRTALGWALKEKHLDCAIMLIKRLPPQDMHIDEIGDFIISTCTSSNPSKEDNIMLEMLLTQSPAWFATMPSTQHSETKSADNETALQGQDDPLALALRTYCQNIEIKLLRQYIEYALRAKHHGAIHALCALSQHRSDAQSLWEMHNENNLNLWHIMAKDGLDQSLAYLLDPKQSPITIVSAHASLTQTNTQAATPLHLACQENQTACVHILLKHCQYDICTQADHTEYSPLDYAIENGNDVLVRTMLEHIPNDHWQLNAQQELDIKKLAIRSATTQTSDRADTAQAKQRIIEACTTLENRLRRQSMNSNSWVNWSFWSTRSKSREADNTAPKGSYKK